MLTDYNNNFIQSINKETLDEYYYIRFDYGTQKIDVKENTKITLDFVHGGFREVFSRVGNDLIIGDDCYFVSVQRLGVGYGKEVWYIDKTDECSYNIEISKYGWAGSTVGYADTPGSIENITMTEAELSEFQANNEVEVKPGMNTLYTTWPVVPNPDIYYHMNDCGDYAPANGKIVLHNYFKYGKANVYVGDELLSNILQNNKKFSGLLNKGTRKSYNLYDSFLSENLFGGDNADKIHSYTGDDTIDAGKGNDKIYLGEGNKTIIVSQDEGIDYIYNFQKADSVKFDFDTNDVYFTKSKNNLILNRVYNEGVEKTVINDYFKNYDKDNKIIIAQNDNVFTDDLSQELIDGTSYLRISTNSNKIVGSNLSDEAYSTQKDETFILKKGNDVIHFSSPSGILLYPYEFGNDTVKLTKGSHVTLDFDNGIGSSFSYERKGNDAVITSRHRIDIAGRSFGKEEWLIKKSGKDSYTVTKTEYYFTGNGYKSNGQVSVDTLTKTELEEFNKENGLNLKTGKNTLYTSWPVVPNPEKHYSTKDSANYGMLLGTVTLKNYFKYGEDSVYIGDKSLSEFFKDDDIIFTLDKSKSKKAAVIQDTIFKDTIIGSKYNDKITSDSGDDEINAGQGRDRIVLGEGNKTVYINKGDGQDTLIISDTNNSVNIVFDDEADEINFNKLGNNLVINREYGSKTEHTVIRDYYKDNTDSNIKISVGDSIIIDKLGQDIAGFVYDVTCKYPPVDNAERVDYTAISQMFIVNDNSNPVNN